MQQPWVVRLPKPASTDVEPFDVLPIKMPLKSKELFSYFAQARGSQGSIPYHQDYLPHSVTDPYALRSVLLFAALHYSWRNAELEIFMPTLLYHKIQCIQTIKQQIDSADGRVDLPCIRTATTLCLVEANFGQLRAAETHLEGLCAMVEAYQANNRKSVNTPPSAEDEAVEGCLLIAMTEVLSLKREQRAAGRPLVWVQPENGVDVDHIWEAQWRQYEGDNEAVEDRLRAIAMLPSYVTGVLQRSVQVDVRYSIEGLRQLTADFEAMHDLSYETKMQIVRRISRLWTVERAGAPLVLPTSAAASPLEDHNMPRKGGRSGKAARPLPELKSSWHSIALATGSYSFSVLGVWDQLSRGRLLRWVFRTMQADVQRTQKDMTLGRVSRQLWFWKVFNLAFGITMLSVLIEEWGQDADNIVPGGDTLLRETTAWFAGKVRLWASVTKTTSWADAREALSAIVWPEKHAHEDVAARLWQMAVSGGDEPPASVDLESGVNLSQQDVY